VKLLFAIAMMNSCINLACQPTVCAAQPLAQLPLAPSIAFNAGTITVTNNNGGSPDAYELWHKPDGTMIYSLYSSGGAAPTVNSAGYGNWQARIKVAGVYSPFSGVVTVAGSTTPDNVSTGTVLSWNFNFWEFETNWQCASVTPDAFRIYQSFDGGNTWALSDENTTGVFVPPSFFPALDTWVKVTAVYQGVESSTSYFAYLSFTGLPDGRLTEAIVWRMTEDGQSLMTDEDSLNPPPYVAPPASPTDYNTGTVGAPLPGGHTSSPQ
jgi:hypothetical protein